MEKVFWQSLKREDKGSQAVHHRHQSQPFLTRILLTSSLFRGSGKGAEGERKALSGEEGL